MQGVDVHAARGVRIVGVVEAGGQGDLIAPGLARLPAGAGQQVGGRGEGVGVGAADAPLDMLRHMSVLPSASFYVGDSNVDIFTARNAGMTSIGVAWGFRGADELRAAQADHVIETPEALTRLAMEA